MNAKPTLRAMWSRGCRGPGLWILTVLVLVGALVQACSDNKGSNGPTFPSGVTGTAATGTQEIVQVAINPNTVPVEARAGITVLVKNANGFALAGHHVQLSTTAGKLDVVDGFTDKDGKFVSFILCDGSFGSATITALADGQVGSNTVTCGSSSSSSSSSSSAGPFFLTVSKAGKGSGTVTSAPGTISCGTLCTGSFAGGTTVVLTATADSGSTFGGFGGCSGSGTTCSLIVTATVIVTATFSPAGP